MRSLIRLGIEILLVAGILYLGWDKAYRSWVQSVSEDTGAAQTEQPIVPRPGATQPPSSSWMWDPNRRSRLDAPKPAGTGTSIRDPNHRTVLDPPKNSDSH